MTFIEAAIHILKAVSPRALDDHDLLAHILDAGLVETRSKKPISSLRSALTAELATAEPRIARLDSGAYVFVAVGVSDFLGNDGYYYSAFELENVKCFKERQRLNFRDPERGIHRWTMILGENGTGKTTLLQMLLANVGRKNHDIPEWMDPILFKNHSLRFSLRSSYNPRVGKVGVELKSIFKVGGTSFFVEVFSGQMFGDSRNWGGAFGSSILYSDGIKVKYEGAGVDFVDIPCFAYGSPRYFEPSNLSQTSVKNGYESLFDRKFDLINPNDWMIRNQLAQRPGEDSKKVNEVFQKLLVEVLPEVERIEFDAEEVTYFYVMPYGRCRLEDLSDGYQSTLAWLCDLAYQLQRWYRTDDFLEKPAIVLIDEFDLHLHPSWQRRLIRSLSEAFPRVQFIVTVHSPLVVQAAAEVNLVLLRREGDQVVIQQDLPDIQQWRVDQILTSELFGLESARPPHLDALYRERARILEREEISEDERERLGELEQTISALPGGESRLIMESEALILKYTQQLKTELGE